MALYETLKEDFQFEDARGSLVQLVHEGYDQVNVLTTKAGVTRGNHYHKETKEAFYVVDGQVAVQLKKEDKEEKVVFHKGDFFCILPYTEHTMSFVEGTVLVAMYDCAVEKANGEKDIFTD